jgi:hypothetical protein
MILAVLSGGCVNATGTSGDALCAATRADRADLAAALVEDGGDRSIVAGQKLIARLDAGCN